MSNMPTARASLRCALVHNAATGAAEIFAMGGYSGGARTEVEVFNMGTEKWNTAAAGKVMQLLLEGVQLLKTDDCQLMVNSNNNLLCPLFLFANFKQLATTHLTTDPPPAAPLPSARWNPTFVPFDAEGRDGFILIGGNQGGTFASDILASVLSSQI